MTRPVLSPRRRVVLCCLAAVALGASGRTVLHDAHHLLPCNAATIRPAHLCGGGRGYKSWARWSAAGLGVAALVALAYAAAFLAMRPLLPLVRMVSRLGPLNLNERSGMSSRGDETHALATALDQMMDRVSAGYEGQRRFAANASHELRTPLAVQRTLIEVSLVQARTPEQTRMLAEQLLATNERNVDLIEGLLVLSETERGLASRSPQRLDDIVDEVVKAHQESASRLDVQLSAEATERVVVGERILLERLVTNLVVNAIAYNRPGGCVVVRTGEHPALAVANTGERVPAESIPGLFEPFKRGTADRVAHGRGAGLGLAIVRAVAVAHGGTVSARPGTDGGLIVDVELPKP